MSFFNAQLINDPFDDPGVYLEFKHRRQAILFDLGDLHALPPRNLLKVDYIFVSHTHMDHFIGFDQLVRLCLGRNRRIALFGPPGFILNIQNRLKGYSWNLVNQYTNDFTLEVTEIDGQGYLRTVHYSCRKAFAPEELPAGPAFNGILMENRMFTVKAACLDHIIPSLAFCFEEHQRLNIKKNALQEMGLPTGPWLNDLKDQLLQGSPDDTPIRAHWRDDEGVARERWIPLSVLRSRVMMTTPGQRIAYVTDTVFHDENIEKIIALVQGADLLFIEASFIGADEDQAIKKYHLTAGQAGTIARLAQVKRFIPFHFSPKYKGSEDIIRLEAMDAFQRGALR